MIATGGWLVQYALFINFEQTYWPSLPSITKSNSMMICSSAKRNTRSKNIFANALASRSPPIVPGGLTADSIQPIVTNFGTLSQKIAGKPSLKRTIRRSFLPSLRRFTHQRMAHERGTVRIEGGAQILSKVSLLIATVATSLKPARRAGSSRTDASNQPDRRSSLAQTYIIFWGEKCTIRLKNQKMETIRGGIAYV